MRRLAELGHSCVAFLSAPRGLVADPDRLRHFRRLARVLGVQPVVMRSPLTITDVRKAAGTLLARPDAPTAIITNSDYTALGIYKTARDLSLRIGPDVSVIGHDDLADLGTARPAAGDHPPGRPGNGPGADGAAARRRRARRLRRPG